MVGVCVPSPQQRYCLMPKHSLRAPWGRRLTAVLAVSLLTLSACSSDDNGTGGSTVVEVEIVTIPNNLTLTELIPGNTRQMLGVPTNSSGNFVDRTVTWASSNPGAATVDNNGLVTAVAGGVAYIRATAGGRTDSISVAVRYPVGTVTLTPTATTMRREAALNVGIVLLDTQGATVTGRTVNWTSSNPTMVAVSSTGRITVGATTPDATTATITATAPNTSDGGVAAIGTVAVTVNGDAVVDNVLVTGGSGLRQNDGTIQLTAQPRSGLNNPVSYAIDWSSTATSVATVDATGLVTFEGGVGDVTIRATATGGGAGGADVVGTAVFNVRQMLEDGDNIAVADINSGEFAEYVILSDGTSFRVATSGGAGDVDLYLFAPGVAVGGGGDPWTGFACRPYLIGSNEACTVGTPANGLYRVRLYAYPPDAVTGLTLTFASPAP